MQHVLVIGAAGFIGSAVARYLLARGDKIVVLDALTYSGRRENLTELSASEHFIFVEGSIADESCVSGLLEKYRPRAVLNLAAETHVDRSISGPAAFVTTNINGVFELLSASLAYWQTLPGTVRDRFRFVQISTDEVYGTIDEGLADENAPLKANSPYSATKASGDLLVRSFHETYGLPTITTRGCNAYGPRQFPEKLIPLHILRGLSGQSLPIYGDGSNIREWIHVEDAAAGIVAAFDHGAPGETYNLGTFDLRTNIVMAHEVCRHVDQLSRRTDGATAQKIEFVVDRPGHDKRYAMNSAKARTHLDWKPRISLDDGMRTTVAWYVNNRDWWMPITRGRYDLSRLGAIAAVSKDTEQHK